jgi:hypothetical protein
MKERDSVETKKNAHEILSGKPEVRTLLGKFKSGFEGNVRLNYKQAYCKGVKEIRPVLDTVQCRVIQNMVTNFWVL